MTRDEALNIVKGLIISNELRLPSGKYLGYYSSEEIINCIYSDFESRTCENCKYVGYRKSDKVSYCVLNNTTYSDPVKEDFGCNKFLRKDNE